MPRFSGYLIARNVVFNAAGHVVPLMIAFLCIPLIIQGIGTDRFGVLTLAWMVVGYFGLFDLGLGLALARSVAEKIGIRQGQDIPVLVWTGLILMLILGLAGAAAVSLLTPWLVRHALKIPPMLQHETEIAFYLLAASIPIVTCTAGLRGILEAHQQFALINSVRIPLGAFTYLGPVLALPFSYTLIPIVVVLVGGRIIAWVVYSLLCFHVVPGLRSGIALDASLMRPLIRFGSWLTVSNIVGPLMVYLDRILIGSLISMAAVAYYATPYEVVTKLWIIPSALLGVLFPAFAASYVQDRSRTVVFFNRGLTCIIVFVFPFILFIVALAHEGLSLWLGGEFAQNSAYVLRWLAVGVFINCLAQVPLMFLQGVGRSDVTATLHLIELPFYLLSVWWLISVHGIDGAAMAWVLRAVADAAALFWLTQRFLQSERSHIWRMAITIALALLALALAMLPMGTVARGLYLGLSLVIFFFAVWFLMLGPDERSLLRNPFQILKSFLNTYEYDRPT